MERTHLPSHAMFRLSLFISVVASVTYRPASIDPFN